MKSPVQEPMVGNFLQSEWQQIRQHGLVWLLLIACMIVAFVVVQQADTVSRQQELIRALDLDSRQLYSSRMRDLENRLKAQPVPPEVGAAPAPAPAAPPAEPAEPEPSRFELRAVRGI